MMVSHCNGVLTRFCHAFSGSGSKIKPVMLMCIDRFITYYPRRFLSRRPSSHVELRSAPPSRVLFVK